MLRLLVLLCCALTINAQVVRTVATRRGAGATRVVIPGTGVGGVQTIGTTRTVGGRGRITGYQLVPILGDEGEVTTTEVVGGGDAGVSVLTARGGSGISGVSGVRRVSTVEESHPAPEPYSFAYNSLGDDGTGSTREETGDASGRVTGFYTLLGENGQERRVDYVADENGFRATVTTNELGTESRNAADAEYISSAPTGAEAAALWESQRTRFDGQRTVVQNVQRSDAGIGIVGGGGGGVVVRRPVQTVVQRSDAGVGGGVVVTRPVQTVVTRPVQTVVTRPVQRNIVRTEAVRTGGGGAVIGVVPTGGVRRFQTVRTQTSGGGGGAFVVPASRVGGTFTERVITRQDGGVGGYNVVVPGRVGGTVTETITTEEGDDLAGGNIGVVVPGSRIGGVRRVITRGGGVSGGGSYVSGSYGSGISGGGAYVIPGRVGGTVTETVTQDGGFGGTGGTIVVPANRYGGSVTETVRTRQVGGGGIGGNYQALRLSGLRGGYTTGGSTGSFGNTVSTRYVTSDVQRGQEVVLAPNNLESSIEYIDDRRK